MKQTILISSNKPQAILSLIQKHSGENILIRVVYDAEGDILEEAMNAANIQNIHITADTKIPDRLKAIQDFAEGNLRVLMGKADVLGKGLNLQKYCHIFIVSGQNDSFEDDYQFKKRLHRIGQKEEVILYRVYTDYEEVTLDNVLKKSKRMDQDFKMQEYLFRSSIFNELQEYLEKGDFGIMADNEIKYEPIKREDYQIHHVNSITTLLEIGEGKVYDWLRPDSIDFSIFSPPFMGDRFTYSNSVGDMGNTRGAGAKGGVDEFAMMYRFFLRGLLTVTKPGRLCAIHVEQVPLIKGVDGYSGYYDFRGDTVKLASEMGWIPVGDIPIIKNQQAQAAVKHVAALGMQNMWKDRARIAPCLNGYLCVFRKPGENETAIENVFKCDCGWEGIYEECLITVFEPGKNADKMGSRFSPIAKQHDNAGRNRPACPICGNTNMQSDMNFDRWVRDAMGVWFENESDEMEKVFSRLPNREAVDSLVKDDIRKLINALQKVLNGRLDDELMTQLGV